MVRTMEKKFARVLGREVFGPVDNWLDEKGKRHFFVPLRNGAEVGAALRVKRVGRHWLSFNVLPLHAELSFFPPAEPVWIVGEYKIPHRRSRA